MEHEPELPDADLIADQVAYLRGIYDELAGLVAVAQGQRDGADKGERGKGYRKLNNPILGQTTPANGIDIADRAVLTIVNKDKATIAAGAEAAARLVLAIIEANRRRAFEENRQADAARNSASKLPAEYQYFFSEMEKRFVTRSMLDAMTQEEFDVLARLVQQKSDLPTHPTLKGLWNFCFRAGIVDHKVIGLTEDEKSAVLIAAQPDAAAGMAACAFFEEAAGRPLDLPPSLALALLKDMQAEQRSRGVRRTADQIVFDDYNKTTRIIRKALGLDDDQLDELMQARRDIFEQRFEDLERLRAADAARREIEVQAYMPAARELREQAASAAAARPQPDPITDEEDDDQHEAEDNADIIDPGAGDVIDPEANPSTPFDEGIDSSVVNTTLAEDRLRFETSQVRFEKLEDYAQATLLEASRFHRYAAQKAGVSLPGDGPVAASNMSPRPMNSPAGPPVSHRDRINALLKGKS